MFEEIEKWWHALIVCRIFPITVYYSIQTPVSVNMMPSTYWSLDTKRLPTEWTFHEGRVFVLFTALSLVPRTVP